MPPQAEVVALPPVVVRNDKQTSPAEYAKRKLMAPEFMVSLNMTPTSASVAPLTLIILATTVPLAVKG
jgi:hypothetical protein